MLPVFHYEIEAYCFGRLTSTTIWSGVFKSYISCYLLFFTFVLVFFFFINVVLFLVPPATQLLFESRASGPMLSILSNFLPGSKKSELYSFERYERSVVPDCFPGELCDSNDFPPSPPKTTDSSVYSRRIFGYLYFTAFFVLLSLGLVTAAISSGLPPLTSITPDLSTIGCFEASRSLCSSSF